MLFMDDEEVEAEAEVKRQMWVVRATFIGKGNLREEDQERYYKALGDSRVYSPNSEDEFFAVFLDEEAAETWIEPVFKMTGNRPMYRVEVVPVEDSEFMDASHKLLVLDMAYDGAEPDPSDW